MKVNCLRFSLPNRGVPYPFRQRGNLLALTLLYEYLRDHADDPHLLTEGHVDLDRLIRLHLLIADDPQPVPAQASLPLGYV